ncbi:MAG TPA: hypothetical protein VM901_06660 [Bdellovibrionota bacterium]|jgi:hypothetical protein|nr:hypothetical protein [Bdellovibrionota bacterium]
MNQEMFSTTPVSYTHNLSPNHISWRAALGGLAVSVITFVAVTALALAFGGVGLSDGTNGTNVGIFSGVSFLVAIVLSTLAGSFYSVRACGWHEEINPYGQSLLVGALAILLVLGQAASAVGTATKAAGSALGASLFAVGASATAAGQSPMVQEMVEDSMGTLNLKQPPQVVLKGVTSRLLRGNEEGAKNYLAAQAGLSPAQANEKIATAKAKINEAMIEAREATATALKAAGWSLFAVIILGMLSALLGGRLAQRNAYGHSGVTPSRGGTFKKALQH